MEEIQQRGRRRCRADREAADAVAERAVVAELVEQCRARRGRRLGPADGGEPVAEHSEDDVEESRDREHNCRPQQAVVGEHIDQSADLFLATCRRMPTANADG